jgi:sterol desaturase/sphingolipid hydroxylase (fatty acid hydroxylase superfamily)
MWSSLQQLEARAVLFTFLGAFVVVGLWETWRPRRPGTQDTLRRWRASSALWLLNNAILRLLLPVTSVVVALFAEERGWGLFHQITAPGWLRLALSLLLFDLVLYGLHRAFHGVPWLWRFHWVHHGDPEYDLTTGLRFHPVEAVVTTVATASAVLLLGLSPWTALVLEAIGVVQAFVAHGNVSMPGGADRVLRLVYVTPDMHRVHHSTDPVEGNSNFGSVFSFWDRLFGSYVPQPQRGHDGMEIGVVGSDRQTQLSVLRLLWAPFRPRR